MGRLKNVTGTQTEEFSARSGSETESLGGEVHALYRKSKKKLMSVELMRPLKESTKSTFILRAVNQTRRGIPFTELFTAAVDAHIPYERSWSTALLPRPANKPIRIAHNIGDDNQFDFPLMRPAAKNQEVFKSELSQGKQFPVLSPIGINIRECSSRWATREIQF